MPKNDEKYKNVFLKEDTAILLNEVKGLLLQKRIINNTTNDETIKIALISLKKDIGGINE